MAIRGFGICYGHLAYFANDSNFRPILLWLIAATPVPILPCRIDGAYAALPPDKRFPRRAKISVRIGKPISFEHTTNKRDGWEKVAETLEQAIIGMTHVR